MPRLSIGRLMACVGVVALNLAAARALYTYSPMYLYAAALSGLGLQAGLFCLWSSRGRARAFWLGLLMAGSLAMGSCLWAVAFPRVIGIGGSAKGGFVRVEQKGSPLWDVLEAYSNFVVEKLVAVPTFTAIMESNNEVLLGATTTAIWFLPQLVAALGGGIIGWSMARAIPRLIGAPTLRPREREKPNVDRPLRTVRPIFPETSP
jgi:hypothetical protein